MTKGFPCSVGCIALALILALCLPSALCEAEAASNSDNRTVTFSVNRPDLWFEGRFPISATWTNYLKASTNEVLEIPYSLAPQPATVKVTVPLSDYLDWLGLDDVSISVPLGNTLLGSWSYSLTALAGIPSWAASLDFRMTGSVKMNDICCSSGSATVQTAASTLVWSGWTTKTAQVVAAESPGGDIRATLAYTLGLGLTLSVLGYDVYDIIPSTTVVSIAGTPSLETEIDVPARAGITSVAAIGASIAILVAVIVIVLAISLRKRGGAFPESNGHDSEISEISGTVGFCEHCGKRRTSSGAWCTGCGRKLRND